MTTGETQADQSMTEDEYREEWARRVKENIRACEHGVGGYRPLLQWEIDWIKREVGKIMKAEAKMRQQKREEEARRDDPVQDQDE